MEPALIPDARDHLDDDDRERLLRFELQVGQGLHHEAQDTIEELWLEANDAHKRLYQAISNGLTAVCAREARKRRGAREIADRTRSMLAPFPRRSLGIDLEVFLRSVEDFVLRGEGPVLLLAQGRDLP
jgi:hypothetical protein